MSEITIKKKNLFLLPPQIIKQCCQTEQDHKATLYAGSPSNTAFEHVVSRFLVVDNVRKLCFHELTIIIGNFIFKGIFVTLKALALVTACLKSTTQDGNTLKAVKT